MRSTFLKLAVAGMAMTLSGAAWAECKTDIAKDDLEDAQIVELYDCIKSTMRERYASGGNEWAKAYPEWGATSTQPAAPGPHGNRFLNTYVNETGHAEYIKFSEERGPMPAGTLIAKESFNVNKKGEVKVGPLFFMEKVAAGNADEYGNWVYSVVQPNGKPGKISQKFCHDCHGAFAEQDSLGYPDEDYRLASQ